MKLKKLNRAVLILFSGVIFGQSLPDTSNKITANFSLESIRAYQENSQNKLDEFYEYLTLYSNEQNQELKKQIRENILTLTESGFSLPDFTNPNSDEISLEKFLSKIENQFYQFKIKSTKNSSEIGFNQWTNSYVLWVSQNKNSSEFDLEQIIYFEPKEKQFGSKTKTVWEIKLGNIQQ